MSQGRKAVSFLRICPAVTSGMLLSALVVVLPSCKPSKDEPKSVPPAKVEQPVKESALTTVRLTPQAEKRLGIQTETVERRELPRSRLVGGEVVVPTGSSVLLSAPFAGQILVLPLVEEERDATPEPPRSLDPLRPARVVTQGEILLQLKPVLSVETRASLVAARNEAEAAVESARVELEAAEVELQRTERMLADRAGSQRAVDEATARQRKADVAWKTSTSLRDLLAGLLAGGADSGSEVVFDLPSPVNGLLTKVQIAPGQVVPAGSPLLEITALDRLWLRVPVYAGSLAEVDATADVRFGPPGVEPGTGESSAQPVEAPPSADPEAATVNLFYEITKRGEVLRPGQKVAVSLPLRRKGKDLTVPWSAIIYDSHGGTWVYQQKAPQTYVRRRVQVLHLSGSQASVAGGVPPGTKVVTVGVAELFGTEFGIGK